MTPNPDYDYETPDPKNERSGVEEFLEMCVGFPIYIFIWVCAARAIYKLWPTILTKFTTCWSWLWS